MPTNNRGAVAIVVDSVVKNLGLGRVDRRVVVIAVARARVVGPSVLILICCDGGGGKEEGDDDDEDEEGAGDDIFAENEAGKTCLTMVEFGPFSLEMLTLDADAFELFFIGSSMRFLQYRSARY